MWREGQQDGGNNQFQGESVLEGILRGQESPRLLAGRSKNMKGEREGPWHQLRVPHGGFA